MATKTGNKSDMTDKEMWAYFKGKGLNDYGIAGLFGNLYKESSLVSNNLQNTGNTKLGMTDAEYTSAVDDGTYTNFVNDSYGYGLAQWTYYTRKQSLKDYADDGNYSIASRKMQCEFIYKELSESYSSVLKTLKNATSVSEASNAVLLKYEKPADTGSSVQAARTAAGETYYEKYAGTSTSDTTSSSITTTSSTTTKVTASSPAKSFLKSLAGTYKTTAALHCRDGAGTSYKSLVVIPKGTSVKNYGYYTKVSSVKWLYIQFTLNGTVYTGFSSSSYLKKS